MAKQRLFDLPQTYGTFQITGVATGMDSDRCFTEKKTKTGSDFRSINFGVKVSEDSTNYLTLTGMARDEVFFTKRGDAAKGIKAETERVPWKNRNNYSKEGFRLIGVNVGVKRIMNSKGEEVNDKKILVEYDATKEIHDNLSDGQSVFTRGNIEYSTYEGRHQIRFSPRQVSLCRPVNFDEKPVEERALFTQHFVFVSISETEDKSGFVVLGRIVTYNSIEDAEFYIDRGYVRMAQSIRRKIAPYTAMKVSGYIKCESQADTIEVDDEWGDANKMEIQRSPVVRKLMITGVDPTSFDSETYSEEKIQSAMAKIIASTAAKDEYGDKNVADSWGKTAESIHLDLDDEDEPW